MLLSLSRVSSTESSLQIALGPSSRALERVYLENIEPDLYFTEAFMDPGLLQVNEGYSGSSFTFTLSGPSVDDYVIGGQILLLQEVIGKVKIARLPVLLFVVAPTLGICAGISSQQANVGPAVGAGVLALATVLQGLATWFGI